MRLTFLPFKQRLSTSIFYDSNYEMQRSLTVLNGWESYSMSTDFKTIISNTCSGRINSDFAYVRPWKTDQLLTVYAALKIWSNCEQRWRLGDEGLQKYGYVSNVKTSWILTATQSQYYVHLEHECQTIKLIYNITFYMYPQSMSKCDLPLH